MHIFHINHLGIAANGTRYFKVKKKYLVSVSVSGFTWCDCKNGMFAKSRNESAGCKHGREVRRLMRALNLLEE